MGNTFFKNVSQTTYNEDEIRLKELIEKKVYSKNFIYNYSMGELTPPNLLPGYFARPTNCKSGHKVYIIPKQKSKWECKQNSFVFVTFRGEIGTIINIDEDTYDCQNIEVNLSMFKKDDIQPEHTIKIGVGSLLPVVEVTIP